MIHRATNPKEPTGGALGARPEPNTGDALAPRPRRRKRVSGRLDPRVRRRVGAACATATLLTGLLGSAPALAEAPFVVDDASDLADSSPGDGTCATSAGTCTLLAAFQEAKASPGADTVQVGPELTFRDEEVEQLSALTGVPWSRVGSEINLGDGSDAPDEEQDGGSKPPKAESDGSASDGAPPEGAGKDTASRGPGGGESPTPGKRAGETPDEGADHPDAPRDEEPEYPPCEGNDVSPAADLERVVESSAPGTTLCLAAASYVTDSAIELKDRMQLIGAGRDKTFITTSTAEVVLEATGAHDVLFRSFDVSGAVGAVECRPKCGRGISPGFANVVIDVRSHDNDTTGIGGQDGELLVMDSELDHNGSPALLGCCASGIKAGRGYTIKDSYIHDNIGLGVWCDVGCHGGFEVVGNVVADNSRGGIRYEISSAPAWIAHNTVTGNNGSVTGGHGGIEINSSQNAIVENNVLGDNGGAGVIANGTRAPGLGNVVVRGNQLNGDSLRGCGGTVACPGN